MWYKILWTDNVLCKIVSAVCYCLPKANCICIPVYLAVLKKIKCDNACALKKCNTDLVQAKLSHIFTGMLSNDCIAVMLDKSIGLGVVVTFTDEGLQNVCVTLQPNLVEID